MKALFVLLTIIGISFSVGARADEAPADLPGNGLGLAWKLSSVAGNFAIGADIASPKFFKDRMHVDLSADYAWLPATPSGTSTPWNPYGQIRLGVCGDQLRNEYFRVYGCGGAVLLITGSNISSGPTAWGGYGVVGFEFFMSKKSHAAYIELGGQGTGAQADKYVGSPAFGNGFTTAVGWRFFIE